MVTTQSTRIGGLVSALFVRILLLGLALGIFAWSPARLGAQDQSATPPDNGQQSSPDTTPPAAGGPQGDVGPYAVPKKKEEPPPPPPEKPKKIEGMPDYSIHVSVPLVEVPVLVTTKDGQFIPNLKQENFRVSEDGVQQTISSFGISQAPITTVLLVEFASTTYAFDREALIASYTFVSQLKKEDYVAVISYDMKPHILADFTQDKAEAMGGLRQLYMPGFSETNLFDALYDTLDRVEQIPGHKYIILVSTGVDTFSKLRLDQILKKVKNTQDVTIFPISIGWALREYCEVNHCTGMTRGAGIPISQIDYLQADNEMQTFARLTGGRFYQPRFQAEFPGVFQDIIGDIRSQYNLAYRPTNPALDGSYRKLKIEVVAPDGGPLKVHDQKGKDLKYLIIAREGYTAKHTVE
jgi:VWFA-related protein